MTTTRRRSRRHFAVGVALAGLLAGVAACGDILGTSFSGLRLAEPDAGLGDDAASESRNAEGGVASCDDLASDFYVGMPAGNAATCLFPTITAATAAAQKSRASTRTIHVANGTYNVAGGETFPFDLRGGISLEGQGPSTVIEGVGRVDLFYDMGSIAVTRATILTGDETIAAHVSGVRMVSAMDTKLGSGVVGIYCNRGNAVVGKVQPAPNLVVDRVEIGLQYAIGIAIGNRLAPKPSGCNALVTSSTVEGLSWNNDDFDGIVVSGCRSDADGTRVAAQIGGDDASLSNRFHELGYESIAVGSCVSRIEVVNNAFDSSAIGVAIDWGAERRDTWVSIRKNAFRALANGAVYLASGAHVDELLDNAFIANDIGGLWLGDVGTSMWPEVRYARRNSFTGNHVGLCLEGTTPFTGILDFGTSDDHGNNVFSCNSYGGHRNRCSNIALGGDVFQTVPRDRSANLAFSGNTWDHAPPSVGTVMAADDDGIDYYAPNADAPLVTDSTIASGVCPDGTVRGP